jgi:hypothetical protein
MQPKLFLKATHLMVIFVVFGHGMSADAAPHSEARVTRA